ncbi:MAG: phage holin family protein [Casimicrobiaceae bacterium]
MTEPGEPVAGRPPLRESVASLLAAMAGSVRTRIELASVEFAEERSRLGQQLALLIAGLGCLLFAVLFVALGVVAWFWDTHRFAAIIGVIVVFAGAAAALFWWRSDLSRSAPSPFAASLAELEKDRAALARASKRRAP